MEHLIPTIPIFFTAWFGDRFMLNAVSAVIFALVLLTSSPAITDIAAAVIAGAWVVGRFIQCARPARLQ